MARLVKVRRRMEEDTELNMVPIMNMFMVLIPFLLISATFFHIKAINTSIPVHAEETPDTAKHQNKEKEAKITVVLELKAGQMRLSALSPTLNATELATVETIISHGISADASIGTLVNALRDLKSRYPLSDTMILIPDDDISYSDIIQAMDYARKSDTEALFPNVVLSGNLG